MGYACPVCDAPQADGEHLANHLAFTALLHGDDHEAWLDGNVPDWEERDPEGLTAAVTELAERTTQETVFEDATDERSGFDPGVEHRHVEAPEELDPETRRIVEEAREMTRRKRSGDETEE